MVTIRRSALTASLLAWLLLLSAQAAVADPTPSTPPQTRLSGTIRYDDQPVPGVYIEAVLTDRAATVLAGGMSDSDGRYEMTIDSRSSASADRFTVRVTAPAGLHSQSFPGGQLPIPATVSRDLDLVQTGRVFFPSAGDRRDPLTPVVAWSWSEDASTYDVQVFARERSRLLEIVLEAGGLAEARWAVPSGVLKPNAEYVVRVFGKNARGTVVFRSEIGLLDTAIR